MSNLIYKTKLIIYQACPIRDGYIVDSITPFLESYPNNLKVSFPDGHVKDISALEINYEISANIKSVNNLRLFNYASIDYYDKNGLIIKRMYYFINSVSLLSLDVITFKLSLDVLNTFATSLNFSPLTCVTREHLDRWNASTLYQRDGYYYVLKNIYPSNEALAKQYLSNIKLYASNPAFDKDYWVKIIITTEDEGFECCYLHYSKAIKIETTTAVFTVDRFIDYYTRDISVSTDGITRLVKLIRILQGYSSVKSIEILPYSPFKDLQGNYDELTPKTLTDSFIIPKVISFGVEGVANPIELHVLTVPLFELLNSNLDNTYLPLFNGYPYTFNYLLFNIYVYRTSVLQLNRLKDELFLNGFFQDYAFEVLKFFKVNEPTFLNSSYTGYYFQFDKLRFNLIPENITFKQNFNQLIDNYLLDETLKNLNLLTVSVYMTKNLSTSLKLKIKSGDYFNYNSNNNFMTVMINSRIPTLDDHSLEYQGEQKKTDLDKSYEKLQSQIGKAAPGWTFSVWNTAKYYAGNIFDSLSEFSGGISSATGGISSTIADIVGGWLGKAKRGLTKHLPRILSSVARRGLVGGALTTSAILLNNLEEQNAIAGIARGDAEGILSEDGDYKITFNIEQNKDYNVISNELYLMGNIVNEYKIPQHNKRKFFDFLQCSAVFIGPHYDRPIMDAIYDRYNTGVWYIHQNNFEWHFPEENLENVEISLLNALD